MVIIEGFQSDGIKNIVIKPNLVKKVKEEEVAIREYFSSRTLIPKTICNYIKAGKMIWNKKYFIC